MKQNIYDNHMFYEQYCQLRQQELNLNNCLEQPAIHSLLPTLTSKHILDLGCGFGTFEQYALPQNPAHITAVDISDNMIRQATDQIQDPRVTFIHQPIEDFRYAGPPFDLVVSSLAFHYIRDFHIITRRIHNWLAPSGQLVFSVEHPILTALNSEWQQDSSGNNLHWPIDHYFSEGLRHINWLVDDVHKYHRTLQTYLSTLLDLGFKLNALLEPAPNSQQIKQFPSLSDQQRRPVFLLLSLQKPPISPP